MLLVEYYQQTSTITSLQASTTMSRFHVFMFLLTDTQQWPFPITFLVLAIFLLLLSFLFSLEALGYLHLTSYYFLPIHSMLILVVFSFLLLFLPTSYVYLYILGFFHTSGSCLLRNLSYLDIVMWVWFIENIQKQEHFQPQKQCSHLIIYNHDICPYFDHILT